MNFLFRLFVFIFIKSFLKKLLVGMALFVIAYLGLDDLKILKSAIGQQDYEVAQQIEIEMQKSELGSERVLKYRVSNTGIKSLALKIKAQSISEKIDYKQGSVFKIYSVTADQRDVEIKPVRPYQNYLVLDVAEIPAGLGLEIYFMDKPDNQNYFNDLDIKIDGALIAGMYEHELNVSPIKIMMVRFSLLFLICLTTSAVLFVCFNFIVGVIQEARELPSLD